MASKQADTTRKFFPPSRSVRNGVSPISTQENSKTTNLTTGLPGCRTVHHGLETWFEVTLVTGAYSKLSLTARSTFLVDSPERLPMPGMLCRDSGDCPHSGNVATCSHLRSDSTVQTVFVQTVLFKRFNSSNSLCSNSYTNSVLLTRVFCAVTATRTVDDGVSPTFAL